MPALRVVDAQVRPAPYDITAAAKGWRFEIDYERVEQSDTWALADPEMRPWLLMLWLTAWKQRPCGSLPNDDALIAARIGMKLNVFRANRDVLMRGWWLADDGKLYHDTIVERCTTMLASLRKDSARKKAWRDSLKSQVHSDECPADVHDADTDGRGRPVEETLPEPEPEPVTTTPKAPSGASSSTLSMDAIPDCPHASIVAAYHRMLPMCPRVLDITDSRRKAMRARWREKKSRQNLAWWDRFFGFVAESEFLTGRSNPAPGRDTFVADLDFLLRPAKFVGVIEGKYHGGAK